MFSVFLCVSFFLPPYPTIHGGNLENNFFDAKWRKREKKKSEKETNFGNSKKRARRKQTLVTAKINNSRFANLKHFDNKHKKSFVVFIFGGCKLSTKIKPLSTKNSNKCLRITKQVKVWSKSSLFVSMCSNMYYITHLSQKRTFIFQYSIFRILPADWCIW